MRASQKISQRLIMRWNVKVDLGDKNMMQWCYGCPEFKKKKEELMESEDSVFDVFKMMQTWAMKECSLKCTGGKNEKL